MFHAATELSSVAMKPETGAHAKQRKQILALLDANGLSAQRDAIEKVIKPGIGLKTRKAKKMDSAVGASRVGGEPDAPADFDWPAGEGEPLLFVLQVNLEDVAQYDLDELLPKDGLLSLFSDRFTNHVTVEHFAKGTKLTRQEWVPEEDGAFTECGVDVLPELHIPPHSSSFVGVDKKSVVALTGAEHDAYWGKVWLSWRARLRPGGGAGATGIHQILGYAIGDDSGEQGKDEEVLLGFDSDDRANMEWGDVQCVWALMKRKDLQRRAWDKLRAVT